MFILITSLTVSASLVLPLPDSEQAPPGPVLDAVARRLGVPTRDVTYGAIEGPIALRGLDIEVRLASGRRADGLKSVIAFTEGGDVLDYDEITRLDDQMRHVRFGKVDPSLLERIRKGSPHEAHEVVVLMDAPETDDLRAEAQRALRAIDRSDPVQLREAARVHSSRVCVQLAARIRPLSNALATRLEANGIEIVHRDPHAPVLVVRADAAALAKVHEDDAVVAILDANLVFGLRMEKARREVRADLAVSLLSATGYGVPVAVVEPGKYLSPSPYLLSYKVRLPSAAADWHATAVASCINGAIPPLVKGIVGDAGLMSANGEPMNAIPWALENGAAILNLSFGAEDPGSALSSFDIYLDSLARSTGRTFVIAAGNSGKKKAYANNPGAGWNELTVGAFDGGALPTWGGEKMAETSSWKNPSTGHETPQVAAPGVGLWLMSPVSPFITSSPLSGTSYSAPIVAGIAALLVGRDPLLDMNQEAVRALIMVSAWHNIESWAHLSSRDGCGGVDALAAMRVVSRGKGLTNRGFEYKVVKPTDFSASGYHVMQKVDLAVGGLARACLVYNSTVSGSGVDKLKADLDLEVLGPDGLPVAMSISSTNSFEICGFMVNQAGTYTLRIKKTKFDGPSEFVATAFSVEADK